MIRNQSQGKVSIGTFAKLVGISRSNAWRIVKRGELPAIEIGRRIILDIGDVEAYIAAHTRPAAAGGSSLVDRVLRVARKKAVR